MGIEESRIYYPLQPRLISITQPLFSQLDRDKKVVAELKRRRIKMKKMFLLLVLAMVILILSGCATTKTYTHEGWEKEGVTPQQLQRDFAECEGPLYVKADMANYETDLGFCVDAERARGARADSWRMWSATVTFILDTATKGLCDRCMKSKGYEKVNKPGRDIVSCMEEKGWEWKVTEERVESKKDIPKTPTPTPTGGKGGIDNRPPWQR